MVGTGATPSPWEEMLNSEPPEVIKVYHHCSLEESNRGIKLSSPWPISLSPWHLTSHLLLWCSSCLWGPVSNFHRPEDAVSLSNWTFTLLLTSVISGSLLACRGLVRHLGLSVLERPALGFCVPTASCVSPAIALIPCHTVLKRYSLGPHTDSGIFHKTYGQKVLEWIVVMVVHCECT